MTTMRRFLTFSILLFSLAGPVGPAPAATAPTDSLELAKTGLDEEARILHALNRLGYGPRPGEIERIRESGLEAYLERQLEPGSIDDANVERRLAAYATLSMTPSELLVAFPPPQLLSGIGRQLTTRGGMSEASMYALFPELERIEARKKQAENGEPQEPPGRTNDPSERMRRMMESPQRVVMELAQAKLIRAVSSERQLEQVMTDFWFNHFNVYAGKGTDRWWVSSYERDAIRPHALGKFRDLLGATAEHPAMLYYLDNWLSSSPGATFDRALANRYAAEANRREGLPPGGVATLILRERGMNTTEIERRIDRRDRYTRSRPSAGARRGDEPEGRPRGSGLNENYARELLELHTLGVEGGYTQDDVVEVARCFTGWTLLPLQAGQQFVFVNEMHDGGTKQVLGTKIKKRGVEEGRAVLDLLARHPQTASFISTKLAQRFVADEPPPSLVSRMAETFLSTDGDVREVLLTMIRSEEFWSPDAVKSKVKTPLEFVASLLRATDAELGDLPGVRSTETRGQDDTTVSWTATGRQMPGALGALRDLGQPLYGAQPPTGFPDDAASWISTGALLQRFKVGFAVAADKLPGVRVPNFTTFKGGVTEEQLAEMGRVLLGSTPSTATLAALDHQLDLPPDELEALGVPARFASTPQARSRLALAWLVASPEFQRK
jgi:uncharacterized protein (DUF1800 family)